MKRFNKTNGMYALLIAVAAMIGITIYGSCSADEDYGDYYYSGNELSTRAEGGMGRGGEDPVHEWFGINSGNATASSSHFFGNRTFEIEAFISWSENQTDANNIQVSCSLGIKNNEMITIPNVDDPLPRYIIVKEPLDLYMHSSIVKVYNPNYSTITVGETGKCYQVNYNNQGTAVDSIELGSNSLEFTVDVTDKVTFYQLPFNH